MNQHMLRWLIIPASTLLLTSACSTGPEVEDDQHRPVEDQPVEVDDETTEQDQFVVEFRDRSIDLYPYVQGFPYSQLMPDLERGQMLYFETTPDGKWLQRLDFEHDEDVDITAGKQVLDVDWSTRSFRRGRFNAHLDRFVFLGDERNDEIFNLYALDVDSGDLEQMTDVDYTYGYGFSEDDRYMGYVVRHGETEPFNSCLHLRDLETDEDTEIWCDDGGDDRLTWTGVDFSDDNQSVVVRIQHDGDRNRTNIGRFDLEEPGEPQLLLERGVEHLRLVPVTETYNGDDLLYISAQTGNDNIYHYDLETGESRRLTDFDHDIASAAVLEDAEVAPKLLVLLDKPHGTIVELRDPVDGQRLWADERDETIRIRDDHADEALLAMSSVDTPFRMERAVVQSPPQHDDIEGSTLDSAYFASIPDELAEQLIHCDVERVEFPTFDEIDGEPRTLHAYLYEPKNPPSDAERLARVTAFYGGSNSFRTGHQLMCEAGITTFSPAPRGSRGFGAEFAALNDGDLGGDDIIDIFYAARWLEEHRGFQPHQIGVHGASHGGYATMRALTFPPETNDRDEFYPFGFGHSHAGVSDLLHFYNTSNIPDWLVLLAGDPQEDQQFLEQRSPLNHLERLESPLLLTHGSNDSRVPVDESRRVAERAEQHELPVVYEEFEGQGHGIDGLDNRLRYYRTLFDFLESEVDPLLEAAGQ